MEFRLLGAVEIHSTNGEVIRLRRRQERLALAVLLLTPRRVVTVERLVELLWEQDPPPAARATLQTLMSRVRGALRSAAKGDADESAGLLARGGGYLLQIPPESVDLHLFGRLVDEARAVEEPNARSARLAAALHLWRGPALAGAASEALRERLCVSLEELWFAAISDRIDADLAVGRHAELIAELSELVVEHPLRERLHGQLMTALYRCGRRADALDAFRRARRLLVAELGLEPGPQLRALEASIIADSAPTGAETNQAASVAAALVAPAQLPPDLASFVGRTADLDRLDTLLAGQATVAVIGVITGTAGVGKTTLAVHWAHRVRSRFPGGQLFINLRGFDPSGAAMAPAEALPRLLVALGVPAQQLPTDVETQAALFRTALAGRGMLIVLDNARDVDQVRPLLPGVPGCLVIVNSRNQLPGLAAANGAHLLTLDLPSMDEAREILSRRLGANRFAAEPDAGDEIVTTCARLPLGLAIVAARAATNTSFRLAALAAELRQSRGWLDAFENGDTATDVRTVFSWSYDALGHRAARLFRLLSLHPGPDLATPAAASLAGIPVRQARALLAELARAHLLDEHAPGRYSFHDLLRAYAAELARALDSDTDRRTAVLRMLDHYLHTAHAADLLLQPSRDPIDLAAARPDVTPESLGDQRQALAWFTAEHLTLLRAVDRAADEEFYAHAWQLAVALADFLDRRGYYHDQVTAQNTALSAARRSADRFAEAHALRAVGRAYIRLRSYDEALTHLGRAIDLLEALGDKVGLARAHHNLGFALEQLGNYQEALNHTQQGLVFYEATGNRAMQANALNTTGWQQAHLGNHRRALASCQHALAILEEIGDRRGQAHTWDSLGYIHRQTCHYERAVDCYERAEALARDDGDRAHQAEILRHLGDTHHAAGDRDTARTTWRQALDILDELGHPLADQVRTSLRRC